nr:synaptobrevin, longin-like domain protein [Tanacetum cinerariifolium]
MIAILEKYEHNQDFHQIVDFVEASHIRYALTFSPTVYVSHIRQFWSTARIETTEERTKILATIDGMLRTVSESSIRRNLKLNDEAGISSLPDAKIFENLTLMRYNISINQKFTFQKGQFSCQWKYLIHTLMQCLSPKSTGFNEFSSNIATALVCLATNRVYNFSKMIFDGMGEDSGTLTEPHHIPFPEAQQTSPTTHSSRSLPPITTKPLPTVIPSDNPPLRQYTRSLTDSGLEADQDRANISKTSTLSSDLTPRVTSLAADEGSMQQKLNELMALCTSLQRQQSEMVSKFEPQKLEINSLKARIKLLEDKDRRVAAQSKDDAPIKGGVSILTSGRVQVVPTASPTIPTAALIFTTATESTPYTRRKGKEKMVKSETPNKKKIQEQMDVQMARQLE